MKLLNNKWHQVFPRLHWTAEKIARPQISKRTAKISKETQCCSLGLHIWNLWYRSPSNELIKRTWAPASNILGKNLPTLHTHRNRKSHIVHRSNQNFNISFHITFVPFDALFLFIIITSLMQTITMSSSAGFHER